MKNKDKRPPQAALSVRSGGACAFRRRAEDALRAGEELWKFALEAAGDGAWDWNCLTNQVFFSPQWKAMLGYAEEEIGNSLDEWDKRLHPGDRKQCYEDIERHIHGKTGFYANEHRILCKGGGYKWILARGKVIQWTEDERPVRFIGTHTDLTDRKQMEAELLRAHTLESLGVLAGGIAHDFNNLMAIVQGYIDLVLSDLPFDHVARQRLLTAMRSVEQTKELSNRLITFACGGTPHREIRDVSEIIRDAVHRTVKEAEVRVKFDFMKNLWSVEVDEQQIKQCFYNLATNAVEALPEGGNLTIQAENARISAGEVLDLSDGSYLKITFADDGIGIPDESLSNIFDPYFTTKKTVSRKGLGLGLAVCYSVLKRHGGHITVKSQPGKGTSFFLYLPARMEPAKGKEVRKSASTGTARVLIMDDEPHIREIERAYLERMGYEVTDVSDGQEAIDVYKKALDSAAPFDLVVLDLTVLHGLGGLSAMERLLKIDPSIRAIIASGYVDDPGIENYADYGFQGALKKPFKGEELKSLVEKILARTNKG
jgi:PAS domain S-box-containing protein